MSFLAAKVNKKHVWNVEKDCLLKRSHITKYARDRFEDKKPSADIIDPFLIAFNAHVLAPDYVKGKDNRTKYARAAVKKWAAQFGYSLSEADIDRIDNDTPLIRPNGDELGQMLGLPFDRREALKLWSMKPADVSEDEFEDLKREKARIRQAKFRRRSGVRTRQQYRADVASANPEPWKALGISKSTYYRRQKAVRLGTSRDITYSKDVLRTESHDLNPLYHVDMGAERSEGGPHMPARRAQQPIRIESVGVAARTEPNPLHRQESFTTYQGSKDSVVGVLNGNKNWQPAAARTEDDNEIAILAEARRILVVLHASPTPATSQCWLQRTASVC